MPFGLDLKSIVVGIVFAMFVWPWISGMISKARAGGDAA